MFLSLKFMLLITFIVVLQMVLQGVSVLLSEFDRDRLLHSVVMTYGAGGCV